MMHMMVTMGCCSQLPAHTHKIVYKLVLRGKCSKNVCVQQRDQEQKTTSEKRNKINEYVIITPN